MKKAIITIMFMGLAAVSVNGQGYGGTYYEDDHGMQDNYYSGYDHAPPVAYQEYYYDYESILPMIGRYSMIYYWEHPFKDVNFVIIGDRVYIIPRDIFFRVHRRGPFVHVSLERFVLLSCFGMSYYDNYYRFSLYNDYYRYNYHRGRSYGSSWLRGLRDYYRRSYRNRMTSTRYTDLKRRFISKRGLAQNHSGYTGRPSGRSVYPGRTDSSGMVYGNTSYSGRNSVRTSRYDADRRAVPVYGNRGDSSRKAFGYVPSRSGGSHVYKRTTAPVRGYSNRGANNVKKIEVKKRSSNGVSVSKHSVKSRTAAGRSSSPTGRKKR